MGKLQKQSGEMSSLRTKEATVFHQHDYNSRLKVQKTPRPIRIEQCFPTGVVRTWYGVCTECGYGAGTERVRSRYGARGFSRGRGVKIALKGPRNLFRGVISLRKNFDFFLPPSSVPAPYFYPVT